MAKEQQGIPVPPVVLGSGSGSGLGLTSGELSEEQRREQRARLIKALSRFKPRDANPQQFYNCVRELCIMHNCSIDEGLERAALTWPGLSMRQRELYDSQRHAELPIPVPKHLVYRAFQKERSGLWSLGRSPTCPIRYTVESYKPPPKPSRLRAQLNDKRPKYDNLLDLPPKLAAMRVPPPPNRKHSRVSPSSGRRIRSPTPPLRRVRSIRQMLSITSVQMPAQMPVQMKKTARRRQGKSHRASPRGAKKLMPEKQPDKMLEAAAPTTQQQQQGRKAGKASRTSKGSAKKGHKTEELKGPYNWDLAIGCVRRRLMMHQSTKP
ncbi:hypothetical protein KR009_011592 [Drosophila setifemur]|nr:hypothetical protein KR009_011592 [Drosophila setifemur]